MRVVLVFLAAFTTISPMADAMGQDEQAGHDKFHQWYQGLRSPEGESCCNDKDCHPVDARYVRGGEGLWHLEIKIRGRWVLVPPGRILPQASPDGGVHACYSDSFMMEVDPGLIIRCVVTGGLS